LIEPPRRLVYLSSGMHRIGNPDLEDLQWLERPWNGPQAYADSKLLDVVLAFAVARHWPAVLSNAVEPGWVATRWVARTPRMTCRRGPPPRSGWPPAETRERRSPAGTSTTFDRRQPTRPPLIASSKTNSSSAAPHSAPPAYRHRRPTGAPPRASRSGYGAPGAE
jgi:NAD(P)-dependent dehydrogenase (short-subunit alcohol dehydrogenase family)